MYVQIQVCAFTWVTIPALKCTCTCQYFIVHALSLKIYVNEELTQPTIHANKILRRGGGRDQQGRVRMVRSGVLQHRHHASQELFLRWEQRPEGTGWRQYPCISSRNEFSGK